MSDDPYDAFLYEYSRDDMKSPDGKLRTRFLAMADNEDDAFELVSEKVGNESGLSLIDSGQEIMKEAQRLGLKPGDVVEV